MPVPAPPQHGQIIRYNYLWHADRRAGQEEGTKPRPCVIVGINDGPHRTVYVVPITHSQPAPDRHFVAVPSAYAAAVGLDAQQSYIIADELNAFIWPGPDIQPVPAPEGYIGRLSWKLLKKVHDALREASTAGDMNPVAREDS